MKKMKNQIRISAPAELHNRLVELAKENGYRRDAIYLKALEAGCAFLEKEYRVYNSEN